jgi:hypothetical protein
LLVVSPYGLPWRRGVCDDRHADRLALFVLVAVPDVRALWSKLDEHLRPRPTLASLVWLKTDNTSTTFCRSRFPKRLEPLQGL